MVMTSIGEGAGVGTSESYDMCKLMEFKQIPYHPI